MIVQINDRGIKYEVTLTDRPAYEACEMCCFDELTCSSEQSIICSAMDTDNMHGYFKQVDEK